MQRQIYKLETKGQFNLVFDKAKKGYMAYTTFDADNLEVEIEAASFGVITAIAEELGLQQSQVVFSVRKLVRSNQVAVVLANSPVGWWSTHSREDLLFLPELVELIESEAYQNPVLPADRSLMKADIRLNLVVELLCSLGYSSLDTDEWYELGGIDIGGAANLRVEWLPVGTEFTVSWYAAKEYLTVKDQVNWMEA